MLTVKGDSMINAGIFNGDKIVVKQQDVANNGDIVVALVDDSATVKRFYKRNGKFILQIILSPSKIPASIILSPLTRSIKHSS